MVAMVIMIAMVMVVMAVMVVVVNMMVRTGLTFKLDFPGNLSLAAFEILAMFAMILFQHCPSSEPPWCPSQMRGRWMELGRGTLCPAG